jgi:hypothetical protein
MASRRVGVLDVVEFLLLHPRLFIVALFVAFMGSAIAMSASGRGVEAKETRVENPTALEMMPVAFVGGHAKPQIEAEIRRTAKAFNLPATNDSFSRMGSALVALRKETRVPEMELLRCARAMGEEVNGISLELDFPTAGGVCAVTLSR